MEDAAKSLSSQLALPSLGIVSIVIPTFNRKDRLIRCVDKIRRHVRTPREVIVVDGGSSDGSREWLRDQHDLVVVFETKREGAVRAFNKGFKAATGHYIMWLNDDAYPLAGAVEHAIAMLERADLPELGMVAFYHNWHSERNILDRVERAGISYELCHVRGYPYANFGLLRRDLLARIGFADERFYFFGFDPDLALRLQLELGLKVLGCRRAMVHHDEHHDERKLADLLRGQQDNARLFEKWNLPAPGCYPDPVPEYRRLISRLGLLDD
jgi:GT2 family glycosyltransferase